MRLKSLFAAAAFFLASSAAYAGIVYEWVRVNNKGPEGVTMRFEFKEAVVKSGSFTMDYSATTGQPIPDDGLINFSFGVFGPLMSGEPGWVMWDGSYLKMNFNFTHNGRFLAGGIEASDFLNTRVKATTGLSANPLLFTIYDTSSDGIAECGSEMEGPCEGATGFLRQVPEPASIALIGLGAVGALTARRRRAQR